MNNDSKNRKRTLPVTLLVTALAAAAALAAFAILRGSAGSEPLRPVSEEEAKAAATPESTEKSRRLESVDFSNPHAMTAARSLLKNGSLLEKFTVIRRLREAGTKEAAGILAEAACTPPENETVPDIRANAIEALCGMPHDAAAEAKRKLEETSSPETLHNLKNRKELTDEATTRRRQWITKIC